MSTADVKIEVLKQPVHFLKVVSHAVDSNEILLALRGSGKEAADIPADVGPDWQWGFAHRADEPLQLAASSQVLEKGKTPLSVTFNPLEEVDRDRIGECDDVVVGLQASLLALLCHCDHLWHTKMNNHVTTLTMAIPRHVFVDIAFFAKDRALDVLCSAGGQAIGLQDLNHGVGICGM